MSFRYPAPPMRTLANGWTSLRSGDGWFPSWTWIFLSTLLATPGTPTWYVPCRLSLNLEKLALTFALTTVRFTYTNVLLFSLASMTGMSAADFRKHVLSHVYLHRGQVFICSFFCPAIFAGFRCAAKCENVQVFCAHAFLWYEGLHP